MFIPIFGGSGEILTNVDGADFDGTNDFMTRGGDLTGAVDSKLCLFSIWFNWDNFGLGSYTLFSATGTNTGVAITLDQITTQIRILGRNGTSLILDWRTQHAAPDNGGWFNLLGSWDLSDTNKQHLYLDDTSSLTTAVFTDDTIDYDGPTDWNVGSSQGGANKYNGALAEFYFAPGQYLDLSNISNRRKFISTGLKPVFLGSTGALPTGTAPIVYFHLDNGEAVANFATNRGTGGNFTITGTLETASTSPSD